MYNENGGYKCWKSVETDLVGNQRSNNHHVDNGEDEDPDAESKADVVQYPGCPAGPLRPHLVPDVVGFTGLEVREKKTFNIKNE